MMDKIWWWFNRKPGSRSSAYWSITAQGAVLCILCFIIGIALKELDVIWPAIAFIIATIAIAWGNYHDDKKSGYVDALYKAYIEKREKIGKKLGKL